MIISINLLYFSVGSSVNLLKSVTVGSIGNSGSNGSSKNGRISVSLLAMEAMGGTMGLENVGGDDVFGEGGRMALIVVADSSYVCFFSFLSLLLLCLNSSLSAEDATSDWVTCCKSTVFYRTPAPIIVYYFPYITCLLYLLFLIKHVRTSG